MNRETSLYLDVWRFFAALVVFMGHVSGQRFTGGLFWQLDPYMGEAVTVFFVLSGFVIGYATDNREKSATSYIVARAARIYSVALPALVATFVLDTIGKLARPDLYNISWGYHTTGQAWQFISGMLFINQIWYLNIPQGSNLSYWSLGYEIWYYVIFGVATFASTWRRVAYILGILAFIGPPIIAMFPLWLLGLIGYRITSRWPLNRLTGGVLCSAALIIWISYEVWAQHHSRLINLAPIFLRRPELAQDYLIGVLFILHLIGFCAISPLIGKSLSRLAPAIRWVAGATFTVYLFHLPISQFLAAQLSWPPSFWATRLIVLVGTLAIMFIVAEVTERRKEFWRRTFAAALRRFISPGGSESEGTA